MSRQNFSNFSRWYMMWLNSKDHLKVQRVPFCRLKKTALVSFATSIKSCSNKNKNRESDNKIRFLTPGLISASAIAYFVAKKGIAHANMSENVSSDQFEKNLPVYKQSEVSKHNSKENGIWVTYQDRVYDITQFVDMHPGGNKILLAAGSSLEPYWALYAIHKAPEIYEILEQYRIGNLEMTETKIEENFSDPYGRDPQRNPVLKPASVKPFNAEPSSVLLVDNFYTPSSIFYVRNHLPVPEVDVAEYRLEIKGIGIEDRLLTLDEIKKFPKHCISATVQCAGNRRNEMNKVKVVKGLTWDHAAIGNATWSGARLTDVLRYCGLDLDRSDIQHVQFEGLDKGPENVPYGASVPSEKALDPKGDVILAYEMNGEPLSRDHGFPLRVIVPGVVGARNVKWVSRIILSEKESDSHWQQNDYKGFSPSTDWDTVDFSSSPAIQELPVISAICLPQDGDKVVLDDESIVVKGYAWSGGGKKIIRVDVSADSGKSWHVAKMEQTCDKSPRHWAWTLWTVNIPVSDHEEEVEIWAKAVDSSYNTQPENFENIWNIRGVLGNAYHKIRVKLS